MKKARAAFLASLCALWASAARAAAPGVFTMGPARFTVLAPQCLRIEYSSAGVFVDDPSLFAVNRSARFLGYSVQESTGRLVIDTGEIRLIYTPDGKPFDAANLKAEIRRGNSAVVWTPGLLDTANLGGTRNLDEAKGPVPMPQGILSRLGWHVVDDSDGLILKNGWVAARPKGHGTDWFLFGYGLDYKAALRALTKMAGAVPLPRKYVLGSWYSRWWPYTSADYRRIVAQYHAHGFPLDILVLDMDWHTPGHWTGYSWNRKLFPHPKAFLRWVHAQGLHVTLNEHPQNYKTVDGHPIDGGVQPFEDRYAAFMRAMGRDPSLKQTLPFDAGSRKYLDNFIKYMHDPLEKEGVDFWWLDYWSGDPRYPLNRLIWLNEYYFRHSERGGLRGQCFARWDNWGDQRHPILFSGDTFILWPTLAFEVPFTADSAGAGAFFWSHDIGGYQGRRNGELLARWTQFGAFSAALRLHSTRDASLDKRPWSYSKAVEDSMRISYRLRSEFFPYTYTAAWEAHDESLPLLRPLYVEYPDKEPAYGNEQEYLYGDSLLVAPIVSPGRGPRKIGRQTVWFPPGDWYDWFTGEHVRGPLRRAVEKDLDSFPLYAKGGVPLTLQPFTERMGSAPLKTLVIRAYPGPEGVTGRAFLYEDDGVSRAYLSGARATTDISYFRKNGRVRLRVYPTKGSFKGQLKRRAYRVELPWRSAASRALLDGKPVKVEYSAREKMNRVLIPARSIRRGFILEVWLS
ncbi:MAG TPA: TIM-barrel domain-containing protein [Elusimicrobiota bacterium]|nr:TIM-barrel domain-containing protein [Elusimicrobiota bacterium]